MGWRRSGKERQRKAGLKRRWRIEEWGTEGRRREQTGGEKKGSRKRVMDRGEMGDGTRERRTGKDGTGRSTGAGIEKMGGC